MADKEYKPEGGLQMGASLTPMIDDIFLVDSEDVHIGNGRSLAEYIAAGGGEGGSSNGMSIPVITTTLTGSSTVSDLRDLLRANGITKDDVCIIYNPSAFIIMVKIDDFDSSSTYIKLPIWFDLNNPLGSKGIIANNANTTISELFQRYEAGLNTTNTQLRNIINELYAKIGEGGNGLPDYTEADNGKFLQIVDGSPSWVLIEDGNGVRY